MLPMAALHYCEPQHQMQNNFYQPLTSRRLALIEFARTVNAGHLVTVNFHDFYTREAAEKKLGKWYAMTNRRIFRTLHELASKRIDFVGFPEYSLAGHIHFHLAIRIPSDYIGDFTRFAPGCWKRLVPTGTFDVRPIGTSEADMDSVLSYITKSPSAADVVHSSMFHPLR